jgi:hypothetical protein
MENKLQAIKTELRLRIYEPAGYHRYYAIPGNID